MRKGDLVRVRMSPASHHRGPMALRPTTPAERAQWYDGFHKRVAEGNTSLHPFGELPGTGTLPPEHTWLELDPCAVYQVLRGRAPPPPSFHGLYALLLCFKSGRLVWVRRQFIEPIPE